MIWRRSRCPWSARRACGELVYYVDGVAMASAAAAGARGISNNAYGSEAFTGRIDEVRVYDRALTGPEIQAGMSVSISGP